MRPHQSAETFSGLLMTFHRSIPRPAKKTMAEAPLLMATDMTAMILDIFLGGTLLLAPSRRDGCTYYKAGAASP